jgi:group I intron endonuclease
MTCGIYCIKNIKTGKIYIGSSKAIESRFYNHRWRLSKGCHHSIKLQRSWNKHGPELFVFEIIETCIESDLLCKEQEHLDSKKPWFNIKQTSTPGALGPRSEEQKQWMSIVQRISKFGKPGPNKGKKASDETINKIKHARSKQVMKKGHKFTDAHRLALSNAKKGKPSSRKGIKFTDEHKAKLSQSKIGKKMPQRSNEHCLKLSLAKQEYWRNKRNEQQN